MTRLLFEKKKIHRMELRLAGRWVYFGGESSSGYPRFYSLITFASSPVRGDGGGCRWYFPTPMPRYGRFHIGAFRHSKPVAVLVRITTSPVSFRSFFGRGRWENGEKGCNYFTRPYDIAVRIPFRVLNKYKIVCLYLAKSNVASL